MSRKVFFSFHHKLDSWRAGQVRNSWLTKGTENTFVDAVEWEKLKQIGEAAVREWIDRELNGTSVTVVLIGKYTSDREWVKYEIMESYKRGNGLLGVYIHGIKDQNQESFWFPGRNPFDELKIETTESFFGLFDYQTTVALSSLFPAYYWYDDNGRENLPAWIEKAAAKAGK